jgi:glycosyltransferase involved in cell wall biosynthesis
MIARLYNRTALKNLLRSADRIILARPGYVPLPLRDFQDRIEYVPVGVDTSQFFPEETKLSVDVFFLSVLDAFHGFKGLENLLEAITLVKKEIPSIRMVVGGGGSQLPYFARMADSMGLGANVRFTGYIPPEHLKDHYNGSRLFVLPSRTPELETFGIVLLEAMACGKPVVTTKIAGMAEDIIRTSSGIIVKPDSPGELAAAILSILKDEDAARKMGENGLQLIREKYLWPAIAARMEQLYKDIQ